MAGVFLALLLSCLAAGRAVGGGSFIHPYGGRHHRNGTALVAQGKPTPCVMMFATTKMEGGTKVWGAGAGDVEGCPEQYTCVLGTAFVDRKHSIAYGIGICHLAADACEASTKTKDKDGEPLCFDKKAVTDQTV